MMLSGCSSAPAPAQAQASAPAPTLMDISQVTGLESTLYVSESASVTRPMEPAPSAEDRASAAMRKQTEGMAPGAVAGGPKDQVIIHIPDPAAPDAAGARPILVIPALSPNAKSRPPVEEGSWKKPLPPLRSLEDR
jgi:hypothetical protein